MTTLYQYEVSPFCDKVRRVLQVKGVDYRVQEVTLRETLSGRLKELSPAAKLPVLDIEGERIADSTEICRFLEARFPEPRLIPTDLREQALVHFFEDWADESLYFIEMHLRFTVAHNAERWVPETSKHEGALLQRIARWAIPRELLKVTRAQGTGRKTPEGLKRDLDRHLQMINQWLNDGDWLVGNSLTLADIAVFVQLDCIAGTVEGQDLMRGYDALRDWMQRVHQATAPASAAAG